MKLKNYSYSLLSLFKWNLATFLYRFLYSIVFIFILIPIALLTLLIEFRAALSVIMIDFLERCFAYLFDTSDDFVLKFFKLFGCVSGDIYLGNRRKRESILLLEQTAKENGIECRILGEMFNENDEYYAKIITTNQTDLNLLKLIFNTNKLLLK